MFLLVLADVLVSGGGKSRHRKVQYTIEEHNRWLETADRQMVEGKDVAIGPPSSNEVLGERVIPTVVDTGRLHVESEAVPITECSTNGRATCWLFGKETFSSLLLADGAGSWLR